MRFWRVALLGAIGFAMCNVSVEAAPSNDPLLNYFSGSWRCKITKSSRPKSIGVRFSYSAVLHGKSLVWTYDDGSSASEIYDPRSKRYLWLGADAEDRSYDVSISPGWIDGQSRWQVALAAWPPPLGAFKVTRSSGTSYTEAYQLRGVTKAEWLCTKARR